MDTFAVEGRFVIAVDCIAAKRPRAGDWPHLEMVSVAASLANMAPVSSAGSILKRERMSFALDMLIASGTRVDSYAQKLLLTGWCVIVSNEIREVRIAAEAVRLRRGRMRWGKDFA